MAYADVRDGWHPTVLAGTLAAHLALLAVAATALHVSSKRGDRKAEAVVALFDGAQAAPAAEVSPPPEAPATNPRPLPSPEPERPPKTSSVSEHGEGEPGEPVAVDMPASVGPQLALQVPELATGDTLSLPPQPAPMRPPPEAAHDALSRYATVLRSKIMAWVPRGRRKEGQVLVRFRLDRGGRLLEAEIARSSGDVQFDRTALRMVRQAAPFPPPDVAIPEERLDFTIPVRFH
ncbi:energy transducer TonB family protein [Aurantiacibacter flavus]|uniref:TonB family protein n=1 Tax=Aurantiacibacter flavus TaxID=3145232 RepID=A0ABV0CUA2_9SPHN